jgi:transposase
METITMSVGEQRRAQVLGRVDRNELSVAQAAALLGLSERQVARLRARFAEFGPAGLVHRNRGRPSPRRTTEALRERVVGLARTRYGGLNDCHLAELLAEREGIELGRVTLRRILRAAGLASPRRRRPPAHRSRRERLPAAGCLVQLDGSRHDWLEGRGPWLTLVGAIDDATGRVPAATFRDQEDAAGYLEILRTIALEVGLPLGVYRDRHGAFEPVVARRRGTLDEERGLSQVGRVLAELGIASIAAGSPQAKGRVERLWGTCQDRLVAELRLAGVRDRDGANAYLADFLPRFNARFAVPALDPRPAWRPWPDLLDPDRVFVLKYRRKVGRDHTIAIGGRDLQLPGLPRRASYAGRMVEVHLRLDGSAVAFDGERELAVLPAPLRPTAVRSLGGRPPEPGLTPAPSSLPWVPPVDHPWKKMTPARRARLAERALTDSLNS